MMKQDCYNLPQMESAAEVFAVGQALRGLPGVIDVLASAAFRQIVVQYDDSRVSSIFIEEQLKRVGFSAHVEDFISG